MENLIGSFFYKKVVKHIFFQFDPEFIHNSVSKSGEVFGKSRLLKYFIGSSKNNEAPQLKQKIAGIEFKNPIGLAAGFDYDARLTQVLPSIGFGFETVGTITNLPYEGNIKPRLGRLPKSKSLLVNKGFKNEGARRVSKKLSKLKFEIPLGISIGKTNSTKLTTQEESIEDILSAFNIFEASKVTSSYYEINISCPNLSGNINFYSTRNLDDLLTQIDKLNLKKPLFVKMPIEKTDVEILRMLNVISEHKVKGIIIGNLQKNKKDPSLDQKEVANFKMGYYSGKPTEVRSNELIRYAYKKFGDRLIIIGCGGIFNAKDAYTKIKLRASLVQLITGLVYEGPFLISEINKGLVALLKKDGYKNIQEAIGVEA